MKFIFPFSLDHINNDKKSGKKRSYKVVYVPKKVCSIVVKFTTCTGFSFVIHLSLMSPSLNLIKHGKSTFSLSWIVMCRGSYLFHDLVS